ncbi:DUF6875 domain-containing protein [Streptomyces sp. NPDC000395]|uniref:DUF6875 domain-containing protein n=1 Tax=Streptomyces sp. NPDC000395 TaxID=3154252 RepID=UPI00336A8398
MAGNCPYLAPSIRAGQTRWVRYRPTFGADMGAVEAGVFGAAVDAAEQVRARRGDGARLACVVVAFELSPYVGPRVLPWPHWALKAAYAPVGVMVGKFWPRRSDTDRKGQPIAAAPLPLLALRAAVPAIDGRLLPHTPHLAHVIADSEDDRRDVFAPAGGLGEEACAAWPRLRSWAAHQLETRGTL